MIELLITAAKEEAKKRIQEQTKQQKEFNSSAYMTTVGYEVGFEAGVKWILEELRKTQPSIDAERLQKILNQIT